MDSLSLFLFRKEEKIVFNSERNQHQNHQECSKYKSTTVSWYLCCKFFSEHWKSTPMELKPSCMRLQKVSPKVTSWPQPHPQIRSPDWPTATSDPQFTGVQQQVNQWIVTSPPLCREIQITSRLWSEIHKLLNSCYFVDNGRNRTIKKTNLMGIFNSSCCILIGRKVYSWTNYSS